MVISSYVVATVFAVSWMLWRRWLGGWLGKISSEGSGIGRIPYVLVAAILCSPWCTLAWWAGPIALGISMLFWLPGHKFDNLTSLLKRYGPFGLPWHFARLYWPASITIRTGSTMLIDGWSAVGELGAGAMFGAVFGSAFAAAYMLTQ